MSPLSVSEALSLAEAVSEPFEQGSAAGAKKIIDALEAQNFQHVTGLRVAFYQHGMKCQVLSQLRLMVMRDQQKTSANHH